MTYLIYYFAFDDHVWVLILQDSVAIICMCMCPFTSLDDEDLELMDTDDDH